MTEPDGRRPRMNLGLCVAVGDGVRLRRIRHHRQSCLDRSRPDSELPSGRPSAEPLARAFVGGTTRPTLVADPAELSSARADLLFDLAELNELGEVLVERIEGIAPRDETVAG